jgi:GTP:adenosylcobinamide-phosphate guanylyltransferase
MALSFAAVALAGGNLEPDFRRAGYTAVNKAYLPVGDAIMLERVLRALHATTSVSRIRCVTQPDAFRAAFGDAAAIGIEVVEPGLDLIDSLLAGLGGLGENEIALVCATDIPLATPSAIDRFAAKVADVACDIGYGFVSRAAHMRKFPSVRHTWVKLREGTFCGSGISAMRAGAAPQVAELLKRVAAARKSPLRIAALFSPGLLLRLPFGGVPIAELEARAGAISGLVCRGLLCDDPELAVNVDTVDDLRTVEELVAGSS